MNHSTALPGNKKAFFRCGIFNGIFSLETNLKSKKFSNEKSVVTLSHKISEVAENKP